MKNLLSILCVISIAGLLCLGCEKQENTYLPAEETETTRTKTNETQKDDISDKDKQGMLIRPRIGAGDIRLEMTVDEVINMLGEPDDAYGNTFEYSMLGISVHSKDEKNIDAIICGGIVREKDYLARKCKCYMKEGIKIGSSEQDIIRAYGEPSEVNEGRHLYKKLGIIFFLYEDKVTCIWVTNRS